MALGELFHTRLSMLVCLVAALALPVLPLRVSADEPPEQKPAETEAIPKKLDSKDFRASSWGMTRPEVKATEKGKVILENEQEVNFRDKLEGLDVQVGYVFEDHRLTQAGYFVVEDRLSDDSYIVDYIKLKRAYTAVYGKPARDILIWNNDLYKGSFKEYSKAVSIGHLVYNAEWRTATTAISLILFGEDYEIQLVLSYSPIAPPKPPTETSSTN